MWASPGLREVAMKQTILLADDSPTIQRLVGQTFVDSEFEIVAVSNGDSAVRKFDEVSPVAVLADVYMPGKNGYEVCAYVRAHADRASTPVILLVGAFDAFDEEHAGHVGATASITKPFEPHALVELVRDVVRNPKAAAVPSPSPQPASAEPGDTEEDLLGLTDIFPAPAATKVAGTLSEEEVERIADRVMLRVSANVVEHIAWDIVPSIADRVVREKLKKI